MYIGVDSVKARGASVIDISESLATRHRRLPMLNEVHVVLKIFRNSTNITATFSGIRIDAVSDTSVEVEVSCEENTSGVRVDDVSDLLQELYFTRSPQSWL